MKAFRIFLLSLLTLSILNGCVNERPENETANTTTDNLSLDSASKDESTNQQLPYIVNYDDATGRLEIDKNPSVDSLSINSEQLITALKNKYPEIDLRIGDRNKDTLQLHIDDATYLTQSMGSTGASAFLAEATYAFTSLDSVKVVDFKFEPGDHAMPGPYDRKYFKDFH